MSDPRPLRTIRFSRHIFIQPVIKKAGEKLRCSFNPKEKMELAHLQVFEENGENFIEVTQMNEPPGCQFKSLITEDVRIRLPSGPFPSDDSKFTLRVKVNGVMNYFMIKSKLEYDPEMVRILVSIFRDLTGLEPYHLPKGMSTVAGSMVSEATVASVHIGPLHDFRAGIQDRTADKVNGWLQTGILNQSHPGSGDGPSSVNLAERKLDQNRTEQQRIAAEAERAKQADKELEAQAAAAKKQAEREQLEAFTANKRAEDAERERAQAAAAKERAEQAEIAAKRLAEEAERLKKIELQKIKDAAAAALAEKRAKEQRVAEEHAKLLEKKKTAAEKYRQEKEEREKREFAEKMDEQRRKKEAEERQRMKAEMENLAEKLKQQNFNEKKKDEMLEKQRLEKLKMEEDRKKEMEREQIFLRDQEALIEEVEVLVVQLRASLGRMRDGLNFANRR